jgi:hypothetical protein
VVNSDDKSIDKFSSSGTNLGVFASGFPNIEGIAFGPLGSAVPEPSSLALLGLGLGGAIGICWLSRSRLA